MTFRDYVVSIFKKSSFKFKSQIKSKDLFCKLLFYKFQSFPSLIEHDRFTTCFKKLWNRPFWFLREQNKYLTGIMFEKLAVPSAPPNLLPNIWKQRGPIWSDFYVVWTLSIGFGGQGVHFWGNMSLLDTEKGLPPNLKGKPSFTPYGLQWYWAIRFLPTIPLPGRGIPPRKGDNFFFVLRCL